MEIKQLGNAGFAEFPQVFVVPAKFIQEALVSDGELRQQPRLEIPDADVDTILGAVYSTAHNRCLLKATSHNGALTQTFKLKFECCYQEFRGQRLLGVTVVDTPRDETKPQHKLTLELANGTKHVIMHKKLRSVIAARVEKWMYEHLAPIRAWKPKALTNTKLQAYLDPAEFGSHYDNEFRRTIISTRICYHLFEDIRLKLSFEELIAAGYITEYPQIYIPAKVLKKYDTELKYRFMGVIQEGGVGGNTMNLQTAKRIERVIGESVSVRGIMSQLDDMPYVNLGPMRIWVLGVATKTTKRLS